MPARHWWTSLRGDMSEIEKFSALLSDIYDAALDPLLWSDVLKKICTFVPGAAANIFIQDAVAKRANTGFGWGNDPYYERIYLEKYAKINPLFPGILFCEVGQVFSTSDIIPYKQMQRTQFYEEYLKPQGWGQGLGAVLEKSATSCAIFAVPQYERLGPIDKRRLDQMRVLVPHVRRAVLIGKAMDLQRATSEMLGRTIDALTAAIYIVDESGRIIHANRQAMDLLAQNDVLLNVNGHLHTKDVAADLTLQENLVAFAAGRVITGKDTLILRDGHSHQRYVTHVLPLTSGARRNVGSALSAVAAIFVQKAALNVSTVPELIAAAHGITPAELAVLLAIIEVGGVPDVASLLGLSQTTIKTHLRSIFKKTNTRRPNHRHESARCATCVGRFHHLRPYPTHHHQSPRIGLRNCVPDQRLCHDGRQHWHVGFNRHRRVERHL
jgi:DNA-binding CsgD family transcriptional regulator